MSIEIWQPREEYMRQTVQYGMDSGPDAAEIASMVLGETYRRVVTVETDDLETAWMAGEARSLGWPPTVRSSSVGDVYAIVDGTTRTWFVVAMFGFDELDMEAPGDAVPAEDDL